MLAGRFAHGALERSYRSAFTEIGCEVECFDMDAAIRRNVRLGRFGESWNRFLPVEPWIAKANRELLLAVDNFRPDALVVFGQTLVRPGALAQVRAMRAVRTVNIWPDTMVFMSGLTAQSLPLYDMVATYSDASVEWIRKLGGAGAHFVPLAADPAMHAQSLGPLRADFEADVGFIGTWRPEREAALARILAEAPELSVKIWGPDWGRRCKGKRALVAAWQGRSLYHEEFAQAVAACKINLNVIDPTNFPAANMRFFELSVAGGVQLCSDCPEMKSHFPHGDSVFYYSSDAELPTIVRRLIANSGARTRAAAAARSRVLAAHTYAHRAGSILEYLGLTAGDS